MSQFLQNILSVPILVGRSSSTEVCDLIKELAYKFRDSDDSDCGLVSEKWTTGDKSKDRAEFDKYGVTSYYSKNLIREEEWLPVADFIHHFASAMISEVYDGDDMGIGNMWTTIYPQGAYVPQHIHDRCLLSGCFYAAAEPDCGDIVFVDPAWTAKSMFVRYGNQFPTVGTRYQQPVETGTMVIFPGWLPHETKPNHSGSDRIIVSFNLTFDNVRPE
jgi:uncharacterized protein (TIGR02466 family)